MLKEYLAYLLKEWNIYGNDNVKNVYPLYKIVGKNRTVNSTLR